MTLSGKTREHISRMMKRHYNTNVRYFVTNLRLEYCVNLLTHSNLSVTDICYECGFENVSWFYKVFEKMYGLTPSEFRKKNKNIHKYKITFHLQK